MKSITAGLVLSLLGSVAMAQTAPAPKSGPQPAAQPQSSTPNGPQAPTPQASAPQTHGAMGDTSGPPEGMIVETPDGFYLVHPGEPGGRKLEMGQANGAQQGGHDMTPGDDEGPDMGAGPEMGGEPPHPHPHPMGGMPHHPPAGKGAAFRIQTPTMTVGVKCPEDEPIRACVDAISQLLDKAAAQPHS